MLYRTETVAWLHAGATKLLSEPAVAVKSGTTKVAGERNNCCMNATRMIRVAKKQHELSHFLLTICAAASYGLVGWRFAGSKVVHSPRTIDDCREMAN